MQSNGLRFKLVFAFALVASATAIASAICYVPKWFDVTITTEGGCGVMYTVCPGKVLCSPINGSGGNPDPIVTANVACNTYIGGSGTAPNCTGGTLVTPATQTVAIPRQLCPGSCSPGGDSTKQPR